MPFLQHRGFRSFGSSRLRPFAMTLGGCFAVQLSACSTPATMRAGDPSDGSSPTGGIAILIEERIPHETRFRRFELHADGTLKVGGGQTAVMHKTDWEGRPSADDINLILRASQDANLASGPPACQPRLIDGEEGRFVLIEYVTPSQSFVYELEGDCPSLAPLLAGFEKAAIARFRRTLDTLPEAGRQSVPSAR